MRSWPAIGTNSTWRTKGSQEWSGNGTGWRTTRGSGGRYSEEQLPHSVVQSGSPLGFWQATDHRGGDQSTQGLLRTGAPSCEDAGRPLNAFSSQDRSIHLGPTDQQLSWPPVAPPGGPVGLVQCTSLVLELRKSEVRPQIIPTASSVDRADPGHRAGVLRGFIQDPANGLPRIPRMRTSPKRSSPKFAYIGFSDLGSSANSELAVAEGYARGFYFKTLTIQSGCDCQ